MKKILTAIAIVAMLVAPMTQVKAQVAQPVSQEELTQQLNAIIVQIIDLLMAQIAMLQDQITALEAQNQIPEVVEDPNTPDNRNTGSGGSTDNNPLPADTENLPKEKPIITIDIVDNGQVTDAGERNYDISYSVEFSNKSQLTCNGTELMPHDAVEDQTYNIQSYPGQSLGVICENSDGPRGFKITTTP